MYKASIAMVRILCGGGGLNPHGETTLMASRRALRHWIESFARPSDEIDTGDKAVESAKPDSGRCFEGPSGLSICLPGQPYSHLKL